VNGKNQILKRCVLIFPAIILGIYIISVIHPGCRLDANLPDNGEQKPILNFINDQPENNAVETVSPLPHQEPNEMPILTEQAKQIEQIPEKTDAIVSPLPVIANQNEPLVLLTVPENVRWLLAAAAPIAAKIRQLNKTPILLALSSEAVPEQTKLVEKLAPFSGSCTILTEDPNLFIVQVPKNCVRNIIPTTSEPTRTGIFLARSFWGKTEMVVMAIIEDSEAMILGSTLASHLAVPFIPIAGDENSEVFSKELKVLSVNRVYFVTSERGLTSINIPGQEIEILDTPTVQQRLVKILGVNNIRNIILFRVPDEFTDSGASSWLAPYLSLMHGAPLIPCYSSEPLSAEENAELLIKTYSLKPCTATILADYDSIDKITTTYTTDLDDYELLLEPCSRPKEGMAVEIGVGRIPFIELWASSTFIARNIARGYVLGQKNPKVLMIANPNTEYGPLPLCETISRATAREFKNFGVHIDEFYGTSSYELTVQSVARDSQLIIFEGHIVDTPSFIGGSEQPQAYPEEWYGHEETEDLIYYQASEPDKYTMIDFEQIISEEPNAWKNTTYKKTETSFKTQLVHAEAPQDVNQLNGLPLVILQSCHSLDESALSILASDAVGIIGSSASIHSASGSAFIKAFCDGLLYRGDTVGEALRDARNYLLCVSELKTKRGHQEQAKVNRVAHSFHLWGDPETRLFNSSLKRPKLQPVSATFIAPDQIHIATPKRRLPTSMTEEYFLCMFPGNQVAGIVKRLKNKDIRRVAPLYFFRIPMPKGFVPSQYADLKGPDETSNRAVFLVDPFERFLYILCFPEKDEKEQEFTLQFVN